MGDCQHRFIKPIVDLNAGTGKSVCADCGADLGYKVIVQKSIMDTENIRLRTLLARANDALKSQAEVSDLFLDTTGEVINDIDAELGE